MKKFISILILFAILLSVCACGAETGSQATTQATTEATEPAANGTPGGMHQLTDEEKFGHINQLEPTNGVYKIWNAEGVKNIVNHPEANFELLCNVDMGGAVIAPIGSAEKPFTGELKGANFAIRNFTVQGGDEADFGFFGVNKGTIRNLVLENVTFMPGENAKTIGTLAGMNEGDVNRCNVSGTMVVENAAADASCGGLVGINTGKLANMVCTVDVTYSAQGGKVGGLIGTAKDCELSFLENHGKLTVTGSDKTTGLFAGEASGAVFSSCVFGGADNSVDGVLFTNFTGNADDDEKTVAVKAKWRDNTVHAPLPENVAAVRQKVVDAMYDLCTVEWHLTQDLVHSCTCQLSGCHGTYNSLFTYYGVPYNHKASSLARFTYCLNEDKTIFDWFYDLASFDGFDIYIGSDCSSTVQQAWWTVSNSTNICNTTYIPAAYGHGTIAVGPYKCDFQLKTETRDGVSTLYTAQYIEANDEQTMYQSYAAMRFGDAMVNKVAAGGHTRMVAADPVIVRDQDGNIDPMYSYVLMHEQGSSWTDEVNMTTSSCKTNWKYTFAVLYADCYVPVTCEELLTGELEPVEAKLEGGCAGYAGMFTGKVSANYQLDYVKLTVTDSQGKEVLDHPIFTTAQKTNDYGGNYYTSRMYTDNMDLADFAAVMTKVQFEKGESYNYTITACLATFDNIVVGEGSFNYGSVN